MASDIYDKYGFDLDYYRDDIDREIQILSYMRSTTSQRTLLKMIYSLRKDFPKYHDLLEKCWSKRQKEIQRAYG